MNTKEKFEQLKELELNSHSDKELAKIQKEFDQLATEDPDGFEDAFIESARSTLQKAKKLRIKEQMREVSEIVSMSYIAKIYFNKTKSWLSQRINELNVNGKPAQFTDKELEILNAAFQDISKKTGAFRVSN
ncbi:MAG: DUF5053 domain-containing protein [Paludibacter sp.]|nr:DUF5053 domain-containing protein [Paludibacter sp.]